MTHKETSALCFTIGTTENRKETIRLVDARALARHIAQTLHRLSAMLWISSVTVLMPASSPAIGKSFSMLFSQPKPQHYG